MVKKVEWHNNGLENLLGKTSIEPIEGARVHAYNLYSGRIEEIELDSLDALKLKLRGYVEVGSKRYNACSPRVPSPFYLETQKLKKPDGKDEMVFIVDYISSGCKPIKKHGKDEMVFIVDSLGYKPKPKPVEWSNLVGKTFIESIEGLKVQAYNRHTNKIEQIELIHSDALKLKSDGYVGIGKRRDASLASAVPFYVYTCELKNSEGKKEKVLMIDYPHGYNDRLDCKL
jgi:hypothetical protein